MSRNALTFLVLHFLARCSPCAAGDPSDKYPLIARREAGDAAEVTASLEVGGELLVADDEGRPQRLPMSVAAKLVYREQLLSWSTDPTQPARSLRQYSEAEATLKTKEQGVQRSLPEEQRMIVADLAPEGAAMACLDQPLSREHFDLVDVVGNTLAIDRLLPNRELGESEGWDHEAAAIGPLLGMGHVAVCEVRSVVTGEENRQVQIRLAGTVHGTIEGAATEMDLRGAYLYHLDEGRITKLNLTIKELRKAGEVAPGLDVVAKLTLVAAPTASQATAPFDDASITRAGEKSQLELRQLLVDSPSRGYRFCHDSSWFVTAEKRELMSLRLLDQGDLLAHCNVTTMPARSPEKPMALDAFQQDVAKSLGDKLGKVETATEWKTPTGCHCLGVFANGKVEDVPVQWRYYHVSNEAGLQATISVTVEQSVLERFADADRPIVDSLELVATPVVAAKPEAAKK